MYIKAMKTAAGTTKYFGECTQPQLVDKHQAFPELDAKYAPPMQQTPLPSHCIIPAAMQKPAV